MEDESDLPRYDIPHPETEPVLATTTNDREWLSVFFDVEQGLGWRVQAHIRAQAAGSGPPMLINYVGDVGFNLVHTYQNHGIIALLGAALEQSLLTVEGHLSNAESSVIPVRSMDREMIERFPICVICRQDFEAGEDVPYLACEHFFHSACLFNWLNQRATCPYCRATVRYE